MSMSKDASTPDTHALILELAHDLQTPLTILKCRIARMRASMVRDAPDDTEAAEIDALIDSMSAGIAEFIVSAACPPGDSAWETFSLSALVREIAEEATIVAESRAIAVAVQIEGGVVVIGNRRCLREAVQNILSNALKYMGDGPRKEIAITLRRKATHAELIIADTGIGIAEADLPHVFERRYRGQQRYGVTPGLGIGLSIVERAVHAHHGSASVASELGVGTTFTLELPALP
jgi:two-component system sensor histidine kinase BaeS